MRPWNLYNASMEIASRCNAVFSKNFVYSIIRYNGVTIDANNRYRFPNMFNIHMIANKGGNQLEFYVNFMSDLYQFSNCDNDDFERIAYSLGHDVASKFGVTKNKEGLIFYFDDSLNYPEYENYYDFVVDGERQNLESDYPMFHHMQTEFDLEFLLFNEQRIDTGISEILKNGIPLFEITQYKRKPCWGILHIEKDGTKYSVSSQDCNFFSRGTYTLKILSYFGQYASLEKIPMLPQKVGMNPFVDIYFSADDRNYLVYIERIRNFGLTPSEMKEAFSAYCTHIGADKDHNWAEHFFY